MSLKKFAKASTADNKFAKDLIVVEDLIQGKFPHYYKFEGENRVRFYPVEGTPIPDDILIEETVGVLFRNVDGVNAAGKPVATNPETFIAFMEKRAITNPIDTVSSTGYVAQVKSVVNILDKDNEVTGKKAGDEQLTILSLTYTDDNEIVMRKALARF